MTAHSATYRTPDGSSTRRQRMAVGPGLQPVDNGRVAIEISSDDSAQARAARGLLGAPLLSTPGQPLRVAVYARIAHGIRTGAFPRGSALPRETTLGVDLGVSRTVVREALMLLEEDGLISTRRGVGRFVSDSVPDVGLEEFRPLELVLSEPGSSISILPVETSLQEPTDFVTTHLPLDDDARFWFREAIAMRGNEPIALIQEYLPDFDSGTEIGKALSTVLPSCGDLPATVLMSILDQTGVTFDRGICRMTASVAGTTRARQLHLAKTDPVLVMTQTAEVNGVTSYLAKIAVTASVGHLSVRQSTA